MKRNRFLAKLAAAFAVALALVGGGLNPAAAFADSSTIVTLGTGLSSSDRAKVLDFFGLTEDDLKGMKVIDVDISDERRYLEGTLPDSVIGDSTISCSYVQPTTSGGINVETANLTYVTKNTLYNALQTAGIENANLVVTAPYKVSGTGALTGIFMAYESQGVTLDDAKKAAATQEMVDTANLESKYGSGAADVVSDVKNEVVSSGSDKSADDIRQMVKDAAERNGISLTDEDINTIVGLIQKIQGLDYGKDAFANTLSDIQSKLDGLAQGQEGILGAIQNFFNQVSEWFSKLFAMISGNQADTGSTDASASTTEGHSDEGILGQLNQKVFQLDSGESQGTAGSGTAATADGAAAADQGSSAQ